MEKSFTVESVEVLGESGSGQFEAVVSVFNNVDKVLDVVMPGAFARSIKELDPPPIVWSHHWNIPPIGETVDWYESTAGLHVKGALFVGEDDNHQYADMVYAGMKSREGRKSALREFSFSYDIPEGGAQQGTREVEGKSIAVQELVEIFPVNEVGPCLKGCNPSTELIAAPKSMMGLSLEDGERFVKIALSRGMTIEELLASLEAEEEQEGTTPAELLDLMLAFPDH